MNKTIVKSYSNAIYDLFLETKDNKFVEDIKQTYKVLKVNHEYIDYISCQFFTKEQRKASVDKLFIKKVNDYIVNFLKILIDNEQAINVCYILKRAIKLINNELDINFAIIETPFAIEPNQVSQIVQVLSKKYHKKIDYEIKINPDLIGGIKIIMNNDIIDGSIKGKLENLKSGFIKDIKEGI